MSQHLTIPQIADQIFLAEDWWFWLPSGAKNLRFAESVGFPDHAGGRPDVRVMLPAGTVLQVRKIKLHAVKNDRAFDFIQFTVNPKKRSKSIVTGSFFVRIREANTMVIVSGMEDIQQTGMADALARLSAGVDALGEG